MGKIEDIEKLLSEEDHVLRITRWVLNQEEIQGARCSYTKEELEEILTSLPEQKFNSLMSELNINMPIAPITPTSQAEEHQSSEGDALPEPGSLLDCSNVPMLPPHAPEPGAKKCEKCVENSVLKDRCKQLEKENELLRMQAANANNSCRCELLKKEVKKLKFMEQQKSEENQQAATEWKAKGQILERSNNIMREQVSVMGRQIEELKFKNAQMEKTLKDLQEESQKDKEDLGGNLRIIHYFLEEMGKRKKRIEELEAEVQILNNTNNHENDYGELYERALNVEKEQAEVNLQMKRNTELLAGAIEKNEGLKEENKQLKEDVEKREAAHQRQLAFQVESFQCREAELARKVEQELCKLQNAYDELMQFARSLREGFLRARALNNENYDE